MPGQRSHILGAYLCAILVSTFASFATAQSSNIVLLESLDSSVTVSGELIGTENGQYQLSTVVGVIAMDVAAASCVGEACPLVVPIFEAGAEVNLTSSDGAVNITGEITDIVDGQYVLDNSVLGSVRFDMDLVDCDGPGCPTGQRFADESEANATAAPAVETVADTIPADEVEAETTPETDLEVTAETVIAPAVNAETENTPEAETNKLGPADASISFAGSDTVGFGLLPFLLEDFANTIDATADINVMSETETFVRYLGPDETELSSIYVNSTGSGDATDALETKASVFGMTSRPIKDEEAQRLIATGSRDLRNTDLETVIAVDSLAVVTHPTNPVSEISVSDLGAIYLGQIDNWSQVGGPDAPITVLSRDDGSSTRSVFERAIFSGEEPPLAERVTYPGGDNPEIAAAVKDDPLAIGYVGFAYSEGLKRLDLTSVCGITSVATSFAVKTEEYPLGRRLYLYNREDNMPEEAIRFLQYALSPDADDAIAQSNFVNFAVERTPLSPSRYDSSYADLRVPSAAQAAEQLKDDLSLWDRLSTTVRFRTASFRLGKKERNDIDRLISTLSELPQGTQIAAVGFTDDVGSFDANLSLSQQRAQAVAEAIGSIATERNLDLQIDTRSYSELSPSVCNVDTNGRAINRRVEIWIRK